MVIFNALLNLSELKELYSGKPVCVCPLYKGALNVPKTSEATGNPIVIPEYKSLIKLTTQFSPKQAGNGDPSLDNVRPISGWDKVQVTRCGKNLCPYGTQTFTKTYTESFGRFMLAGTYTFSATVTSDDTEYTTSLVFFFNTAENKGVVSKQINRNTRDSITVDAPSPFDSIYLYASVGSTQSAGKTATFSDIQLELGSTPTPYEPYQGDTYDMALPETVYGGTVDAVTGAGSKTWGYIASYNRESLPGEWISDRDVYAPGTTPTTGAQVAYKLATPKSFKVSQVTIPSLIGENYFFTNGENMDIIYKKESFWSDEA